MEHKQPFFMRGFETFEEHRAEYRRNCFYRKQPFGIRRRGEALLIGAERTWAFVSNHEPCCKPET